MEENNCKWPEIFLLTSSPTSLLLSYQCHSLMLARWNVYFSMKSGYISLTKNITTHHIGDTVKLAILPQHTHRCCTYNSLAEICGGKRGKFEMEKVREFHRI